MVTALLASISLFAQAFSGTWTCYFQTHGTEWTITAAPGSAWTTVRWGDQSSANGGVAYVGFIPQMRAWVYRDFHYDGSYADVTSPGPSQNAWTWSGPYYAADRIMYGNITWTLTSPDRIERTFRKRDGDKLTPTGNDYCTRTGH